MGESYFRLPDSEGYVIATLLLVSYLRIQQNVLIIYAGKPRRIGTFDSKEDAAEANFQARQVFKANPVSRHTTPEEVDKAMALAREAAGVKPVEMRGIFKTANGKWVSY
jgi:hypothetical protein